jgi:hypothetical protein
MVMVIGMREDKADISFQGKHNRRRKSDGILGISASVIEKGITRRYANIAEIKKIANISVIKKIANISIEITVMITQVV